MRNIGYYRPPGGSSPKKHSPKKRPSAAGAGSLIKIFLILFIFFGMVGSCAYGVYKLIPKITDWAAETRRGDSKKWTFKSLEIANLDAAQTQKIKELLALKEGRQISVNECRDMEKKAEAAFPELRNIKIKRGLISGKLRISAETRTPVALVVSDSVPRLLGEDGVLYTLPDMENYSALPIAEIEGKTGDALPQDFVELTAGIDKLRAELHFESILFSNGGQKAKFLFKNGSEINMGSVENINFKAKEAAKILKYININGKEPFVLDLQYYKYGKAYFSKKSVVSNG